MVLIQLPGGRRGASSAVSPIVILLAVVACGGPHPAALSEPSVADIPVIRSTAELDELVLPLDAYLETPQSRQEVDRAINLLGRDCMRRLGLEWPQTQADYAPARSQHSRRYGITDADRGYHPPPAPEQIRPPDQWPVPTPEQATAWTGQQRRTSGGATIPPGGCAGEAMRALLAGAPEPPVIDVQRLANEALAAATADSRVQAAFGQWSRCLRRSGLHYESPWDINDDPKWHQAPEPTEAELAAARVDVGCRRETNLVGIWFATERSYQLQTVRQHGPELAALRRVQTAQHEAAVRVIASAEGR